MEPHFEKVETGSVQLTAGSPSACDQTGHHRLAGICSEDWDQMSVPLHRFTCEPFLASITAQSHLRYVVKGRKPTNLDGLRCEVLAWRLYRSRPYKPHQPQNGQSLETQPL